MQARLNARKLAGNYRELKAESGLVDFCSNDYLGFARSAALKSAIAHELESHPQHLTGATGSRLLSGNSAYAEDLETNVAAYHNAEAGLLFNSGYDANLGLLSSLPQKGDTILCDELIHASLIDGARLSHATRLKFKHNNLSSLEAKLTLAKGTCYVVVESVYSMDGDTPPLAAILQLTQRYNALLIVDEAHAVGIYPKGLAVHLGLEQHIFARVVTFGKALGSHGAVVLGSALLKNYLVNFARSFIYSTAAPFHQLAAIKSTYALLYRSAEEITKLKSNIGLFKHTLTPANGYSLLPSDTPIQCILFNSNAAASTAALHLQQTGFDVRAILSPTVASGTERIRICLHSFNTAIEISQLCQLLNAYFAGNPIHPAIK
ncbi:pyridoxal phosphate-dependent aminotransferase family protein [Inquilinus sp. KBS0705]|nr:pyridoxal phosphate-dependent aminotransferase family protein [Inquilinus sp. KBS0705]